MSWTHKVDWSDIALAVVLSVCVVTCGWSPNCASDSSHAQQVLDKVLEEDSADKNLHRP